MGRIWDGKAYVEESEEHAAQAAADAALFARPPQDDLIAHAKRRQQILASGGFSFALDSSKIAHADTDIEGRTNLSGLVQLASINPDFTSIWVQSEGNLTLTASQIVSLGVAVGKFVEETFRALGDVIAKIGSETIRTYDEVDAYAWPSNSG